MSTLSPTTPRNLLNAITGDSTVNALRNVAELGGRVLLAALFLISGMGKIGAYAGTAGYMSALGVPAALLPVVIATEVLGAIAIIVGWKTRVTAFLLAGFTLLAGLLFHSNFADQIQMIMFLKNVAITGAFLLLVANGAGALSLDHRFDRSTNRST
jgi:putative oxidoreductase